MASKALRAALAVTALALSSALALGDGLAGSGNGLAGSYNGLSGTMSGSSVQTTTPPPSGSPSLDFSQASNSDYLSLF